MKFAAILLIAASTLLHAADPEPVDPRKYGYKLAWGDEFDGSALDAAKWHTDYAPKVHPPGTNGEKQGYAPENVLLRDGRLVLRAERKERGGLPFTSGMVSSHDKFSQHGGWFEARLRVPRGKGLWPAFWMLPADKKTWPPEIDIFEHKGRLPNRAFLTLHEPIPGTWHPKSTGKEWDGPDFTADFHTFAVEWLPDRIVWFVDGIERFRTWKKTPEMPMYLLLNLAVGGMFDGAPNEETKFPAEMEIDWVRVFAR